MRERLRDGTIKLIDDTTKHVIQQRLQQTLLRGLYLAVPPFARIQSTDPRDIRVAGNPALCRACARIFSKSRQLGKESVLSTNFARLEVSAELGCYICKILYNALWTPQSSRRTESLPVQRLRDISSKPGALAYWIDVTDQDKEPGCFDINFVTANPDTMEDVWFTRLILVPEKALYDKIPQQLSELNNIDIATRLATKWIEHCENNHTHCRVSRQPSTWRPTRLIHVGHGDSKSEPRLCLSNDIPSNARYVTLSHCWGRSDIFKLMQANLGKLIVRLPLELMPTVFRDAIEFSRNLHVEYIWIDSLCIIQDSYEDWARESAMMGEVYNNSWCNISATGFPDGNSSLYVRRIPDIMKPRLVSISLRDPENTAFRDISNESYYCMEDIWQCDVTNAPANTRAWVFQERLLSPRVFHFGSRQVLWECKELEACEVFPNEVPAIISSGFKSAGFLQGPSSIHKSVLHGEKIQAQTEQEVEGRVGSEVSVTLNEKNLDGYRKIALEPAENSTKEEFDNSEKIYFVLLDKWRQITGAYSSKVLTRSEDKLVAISGVAGVMAKFTNEKYIAGLWKRNFMQQLLWYTVYEAKDFGRVPRPQSYQGPSWSWACLNACVDDASVMNAEPLGTIIDYSVTLADKNPFGQITDGYLRIRGRLSYATFVVSEADLAKHWEERSQPLRLRTIISETRAVVKPLIIPDTHRAMPQGKKGVPIYPLHYALGGTFFWLLPICLNPSGCVGLVLRRTRTKGQYQRIALFIQFDSSEEDFQTLLNHRPLLGNDEYEESAEDGNVIITII